MSAQNDHVRCDRLYERIKGERDRLLGENVDLELQKDELEKTLENERAAADDDRLKKAEENDLLNQRVVADCETRIHKNLEKISKQFEDEQSALQLKVDELEQIIKKEKAEKMNVERDLEKEKKASKAELNKKDEELSLFRADYSKLLIENQQLKENDKSLHDQVNLLEVEASKASSLNNEQQEKITTLENDLQASEEKLNTVVLSINTCKSHILDVVNGKQQTDQVAPVAPLSSQSFVDNNFDSFSTEDQQPMGAEPVNVSKNSINEEVSEAAVAELPSFSREHGFSNGSSSPQVQPVSEDVVPPIVKTPSHVTRPHRDGVDYGTKPKKPVRPLTDKRRASSPAATPPKKMTKKNSRRQNNDNDELDFNSVDLFDNLYKRLNAESTAGVHQNPVMSHNLRSRTSVAVAYNGDTESNSGEADYYSDSEDTTIGTNRKNIPSRSRSCATNSIKKKFTANEFEFQSCIIHNKVVVFAPGNKCYNYHYQVTNKNYRCGGCSDGPRKKFTVIGTIERDDNGEKYFWAYDDHVCEPHDYSNAPTRFRGHHVNKATSKIYDFELAKTLQNRVKIVVPFTKNDRKMCYFFLCRYDKPNLYVCKRCASHKPPRYVPGGFGKDENGKEYFETLHNRHVCNPHEYNPAEIIKTNAHHSQIHP